MAEEARGSVELAVIAFPGSKFKGEIVPALADLVDSGVVAILDLLVVSKSDEGDVVSPSRSARWRTAGCSTISMAK